MRNLTILLSLLTFQIFLTGCSDTGGQIIGYVNGVLSRSTMDSHPISVREGESATALVQFSRPLSRDSEISWKLNAALTEFKDIEGSVVAKMNSTSVQIPLSSIDNLFADGTRIYNLDITGSVIDFTNNIQITVQIIDNESHPVIAIADANVVEGTGAGTTNLSFTISASHASETDITVDYATSDITATAGVDYTASTGTATIPAGSTSTTISVPVTRDAISEGSETFRITLSGGAGYTVAGSTLTAVGTILDDEGVPTISIADINVTEGTGAGTTNAVLTVTAVWSSSADITVNYATSNGTALAASDYTSATGSVTILAGSTTATITVPVTRDSLYEGDETFVVTLSGGAGYTVPGSDLSSTVTIDDDDTAPTISIADVSLTEGNSGSSNMTFTVTASTASAVAISVAYATTNGSATAGSDYTSSTGTVTIAAGATTGTFNVPVSGDTLYEGDETLTATLSGGSGYTAAGSDLTATGTITNDDTAPTISIANVSVTEGTGAGTTNLTFTVTASAASGLPVTVSYATTDGTASAGADYTATTGSLTISAGSTTGDISVPITRDSIYEANETLTITLSAGSGYTVAGSTLTATGTITDDDGAPTISIADVSLTEGNSGSANMTFTISASATSGQNITVGYATSNGTATAGSDYTSTTGTATILAGALTTTLNVPIAGDVLYEANETFTVTLSGGSGYTTTGSTLSATGTINNDDTPPTISIADASRAEGNSGTANLTFTVTASAASAVAITVDYATSDVSATAGVDYTSATGTVTIPAGSTTGTLNVSISGDTLFEGDETFTVTLSGGAGYTATGSDLSATGTITNDDTAPTISIANNSRVEGNSGSANLVFTITASAVSYQNITVSYATSNGTATAGTDYTSTSGTATITAGSLTTTINVPILGDAVFETDEDFTITLSAGAGYTATGSTLSATGVITNDDAPFFTWDFANALDYSYNPTYIDLSSGTKAVLSTVPSTYNSQTTFNTGSHSGTDATSGVLKLSATTGADTTLNSTWAPNWSTLDSLWRFDGNWNDSGPNARTLTASGASATIVNARPQVGSEHARFASSHTASTATYSVDLTQGFSVSAWVSTTGTTSRVIVQKGSGTDMPIQLKLLGGNLFECSTANGTLYSISESTALVAYQYTWTHAGCVYDPNQAKLFLYVQGIQRGSVTVPAAPTTNSSILTIGGPTTFFSGDIDEVAIWKTPLIAEDMNLIYQRQKQKYSGLYRSQIIDMGHSSATWPNLKVQTPFPYEKMLVPAAASEAGSYADISGTLSANLKGYWRFDEAIWTAPLADVVKDSSGNNNHGTPTGGLPLTNLSRAGNAPLYSANGHSVRLPASSTFITTADQPLTLSAWVRPTTISNTAGIPNRVISIHYSNVAGSSVILGLGSSKLSFYAQSDATFNPGTRNIELNVWQHIALTYNGTCFQLYVNGETDGPCVAKGLMAGGSYSTFLGNYNGGSLAFAGSLDEVGIWARHLSTLEIAELYRRTATRVKYQVRSCVDATCRCKSLSTSPVGSVTDCDGDGIANDLDAIDTHRARWFGADGTGLTYFSELHNNSQVNATGLPTGTVQGGGLNLDWSTPLFTAAAKPIANRYFQYRVLMESESSATLCSGAPCLPEVTSLTVGPATARYFGGSPTIINNTPLNVSELLTMTRSDTGSCTTYQISKDGGATWLWWNSSAWTPTVAGVSQSNYLSDYTTARLQALGAVSFKFKAFLNTNTGGDFSQACELNKVETTFNP